ncbi:MAG TPA: DUF4440 domain-containing protein [Pyrinomonadaceae bacterium]
MCRFLPLLGLLLIFCPVGTQALIQSEQQQIEKDIWIPFLTASNAFDANGFLAVQSDDFVRVAVDRKEVYGLARYRSEIREGFVRALGRGIKRRSEVRFLERNASDNLAYETGYFREQVTLPGGEVRTRYARFEFVLRKESGKWKILIDRDTASGATITEEVFRAARPLVTELKR